MTESGSEERNDDLTALAETVGARLAAAREKAKIDIRDAARQLRLTSTALRDLEQGDLEKLGADVYARGYLKSYATLVDADVDDLLSALDQRTERAPELPKMMRPQPRWLAFDRYARAATYVAGTSLLLVPIYWFIESGGVESLREAANAPSGPVELALPPVERTEQESLLLESEPTMATMAPFRPNGSSARPNGEEDENDVTDGEPESQVQPRDDLNPSEGEAADAEVDPTAEG